MLNTLSDVVSHNAANVALLVKDSGTAVILASVLAHLKNDLLLLPALNLLGAISRTPSHVPALVREGGVPAVLAAILAHLRRPDVLKAALLVLKNIVADHACAIRLGGQGAYRIVFAVLQASAARRARDHRSVRPPQRVATVARGHRARDHLRPTALLADTLRC